MTSTTKRPRPVDSENNVIGNKRAQHNGVLLESTKVSNMDNIMSGMISPPITPDKQRVVQLDENSLTPKKLALSTPPATPSKQSSAVSVYTRARSLFQRGSMPTTLTNSLLRSLPSREIEANTLNEYLTEKVTKLEPGSLYISGPPGTGKTAQTTASTKDFLERNSASIFDETKCIHNLRIGSKKRRVAYIQLNCMIIQKPELIYNEICKRMLGKSRFQKYTSKDLKELLVSDTVADISIVVLDELDNLITGNQQILFELFSYASSVNEIGVKPKLVLIGIANALDLTDRFLPRLRTNRISPTLLQFLPYSSEQIKNVIESKLRSISTDGEVSLIHPAAIQLCAKKTAANTGDLRKAFDICHRSIELVEEATKAKLIPSDFQSLTISTAPKVSIAHVAKVCSMVFNAGNFSSDGGNKLKNLNLQQKTVICSLIKFEQNSNKLKTINEFYQFYRTKIKLDSLIGVLKKGEFLEVITTLESFGIINSTTGMTKKNVELGTNKISGNVRKEDLMKAVNEIDVLRALISSDM